MFFEESTVLQVGMSGTHFSTVTVYYSRGAAYGHSVDGILLTFV